MSDILTMNDEDFLKNINNLPGDTPAVVVEETPAPVEEVPAEVPAEEVPTEVPAEIPAEEVPAEVPAETPVETPAEVPAETPPVDTVDYKAVYESLFGREFKAGGKTVKVQTPEEAIQLMQMGVGFHQNSQKLAQHRRYIATLEENGLLTEEKINELIDISKKNPEAIKALVQSAGLEPHQLLPSGDVQTYVPGQHVLPEKQLRFRTSVEEVREQGGEEFLAHVAQDWDVTSRTEIFEDPSALTLIYGHKQNGMYEQISSEVERRKVFNPEMANMPFIHAYLKVGNELFAKQPEPAPTPVPVTPVAVTPVAVKPAVASQPVTPNPAAAKAAAVRSAPAPVSTTPNYLTMSDEEFMKHHAPK